MDELRRLLSSTFLLLSLFYTSCSATTSSSSSAAVHFWNARNMNVSLPNHFLIDEVNGLLVIAANNSVCHLSFDFTIFTNVLQAEPDPSVSFDCQYRDARSNEECQNYHHVLQFPRGPGTINDVPLNQTVLTCGSNAFSPQCFYRMRNNLQVVADYSGTNFCSVDMNTETTSLWTSDNRLVSASKTLTNKFGIRVSTSPYNGMVAVATRPNDNFWINKSPQFVSMYEIGEHIYVFFREEAVEVPEPDKVIYSRVARVCKNDTGTSSTILGGSDSNIIFLTFIKARVSCSSGSGIPFHYNNIQDTFLLQSSSYDGGTNARHLYAIFTSSENGPVGSAVCIYTFYSQTNDLGNVFRGNYKRRSATDGSIMVQENYEEFSCNHGSRTVEDARDIQLMESSVKQSNGNQPLLELGGYTFSKIVVDQMTDANGTKHEVMFVTAHKDGQLFLIKGAYSSLEEQKYHVISTTLLGTDSRVTKMLLRGSGASAHIFIGTENGIYRVPTADCARFTDCCSCVAARDPYCTYDLVSHKCLAIGSTDSDRQNLLQDFARGNSSLCSAAAMNMNGMSTAPSSNGNGCSTSVVTMTTEVNTDQTTAAVTYFTGTIGIGGVSPTSASRKVNEHIWTIVGAVSGFIGGVVIGIILMAFFYQRGNIFRMKSTRRPRRRTSRLYRYDSGEEGKDKENSSSNRRRKSSGATEGCKKEEEFLKNNHELSTSNSYVKSNEYTNVPPKPNGSTKFVLNPVPTTKGTSRQEESVNPPAKFVLNPVPTTKGACRQEENTSSPAKFVLNPVPTTKGTRQEMAAMGNGAAASGGKYAYHSESMTGKGSSATTVAVAPPIAPKPKISVGSYGRRMTSSGNHSDVNLKSNQKLEESLTNHDRDTYGRNLLARQPSIDTTNKLANGNGRTRLPAPIMQISYDRRQEFVNLSDVPRTCSQC